MKTTIYIEGPKEDKLEMTLDNDYLNNLDYINLRIEEDNIELLVSLDDLDAALEGFKKLRKNYGEKTRRLK